MTSKIGVNAFGFILFLFITALVGCSNSGVEVVIKNQSGLELTDVNLSFTGGKKLFPRLGSLNELRTRVRPTSASHLNIGFKEPSGKEHKQEVDTYFEPGYKGTVSILIGPGGIVSSTNSIGL
jgi:hypothetical protein